MQVKNNHICHSATLRIIATSDLHLNLRAYDYESALERRHSGLNGLAGMIEQARNEAGVHASLLLDNGDTIQGSPLSKVLDPWERTHPIAKIFNALNYDAVGLGNHDFDFSSAYLDQVCAQLNAPVISSNFSDPQMDHIQPHALISKSIQTHDGEEHTLKIGVISALPVKTKNWNSTKINESAQFQNMQTGLSNSLCTLKNAGADLIVLLAHTGLQEPDGQTFSHDESQARQLASCLDVQAVVAGHTHKAKISKIDKQPDNQSTISSSTIPIIQPGFDGTHLGIIDLHLDFCENNWRVRDHSAQLRENTGPEAPKTAALSDTEHAQALAFLHRNIGTSRTPFIQYFSLLGSSESMSFFGRALQSAAQEFLSKNVNEQLPVLACTPHHSSHENMRFSEKLLSQDGKIDYQQVMQIFPHEDNISILKISGRQIKDWLMQCAGFLHPLKALQTGQALYDSNRPIFHFDSIYGLSYHIDPSQEAFDLKENIKNFRYQNKTINDDDAFYIAMSNYRANGGGGFPHLDEQNGGQQIIQLPLSVHDAMINLLKSGPFDSAKIDQENWQIYAQGNRPAIFDVSVAALPFLDQISLYKPKIISQNAKNIVSLQLMV